jgi:sulfite reductase beta subunit-like hemoprotein
LDHRPSSRTVHHAAQFGQGDLFITTRQTLQFHWLRLEDLPLVLKALDALGLDSTNACGDVTRNVVTCPLQGVCPHEVGDVRDTILALANDDELKSQQRNLPRKHKISVAGCDRACAQTRINCQGWHPLERATAKAPLERGFRLYAGGGLGPRPYFGQLVYAWVPADLVVSVARAVTEHYRRHGNRTNRSLARLKIVVAEQGAERFGREVLELLRARGVPGVDRIEPATGGEVGIGPSFLEGQSVVPQRQVGFNTVRIRVYRGELNATTARSLAALARTHGDGSIQLTARQNLSFRFVPDAQLEALLRALQSAGWRTEGLETAPDVVACVGTTLCNLAVSDTPSAHRKLVADLEADKALSAAVGPLRIHLNGCPNSCAQHWIADIGLRGMRREQAVGSEEGFSVHVGGSLEGAGRFARPVCEVPSSRVVLTVQAILRHYLEARRGQDEAFGAFVGRVGPEAIATAVGVGPPLPEPLNVRHLRIAGSLRGIVEEARHVSG